MLIAAIPEPKIIPASAPSNAAIFSDSPRWFGVLKYLGYCPTFTSVKEYEVEAYKGEIAPPCWVSFNSPAWTHKVLKSAFVFIYSSIHEITLGSSGSVLGEITFAKRPSGLIKYF